jgi:hypothetical protein
MAGTPPHYVELVRRARANRVAASQLRAQLRAQSALSAELTARATNLVALGIRLADQAVAVRGNPFIHSDSADFGPEPAGWRPWSPTKCPAGHWLTPARAVLGWSPCECTAGAEAFGGHRTWTCRVVSNDGGVECGELVYAPPHHAEPRAAPMATAQRASP